MHRPPQPPDIVTQIPLFEELRGARVLLRPYREADADALFEAIVESREHLRRFLPWERFHQTVADSREWIARMRAEWLLRRELTVGIWEIASGRYLGGSGYHPPDWDARAFEIGYWLRVSAEGHGYMSEAVRLLVGYAFDQLHANRVEITCDARNSRSAAVARRLGFQLEGRLRNQMWSTDSPFTDRLIFALTPSDPRWPSR
jgi:RimJ/RimL family protein N-acetyltransferase